MRYLWLVTVFFLVIACDNGGGSSGGGEDIVPGETTPPEFRDLRVEIQASPSIPLDLNNKDVERILPLAFPAVFTVFTTDDTSEADALIVTILEGDGTTPVDGQAAAFANGLWTVEVPVVAPGQTFRVRVEDEAGNGLVWDYSLTILTLEDAVVGDWDTRFYDELGAHSHSWEATWNEDGTWEESRVEPAVQVEGTWALDGDLLTVAETKSEPGDEDPTTVDLKRETGFYVDEIYFAAAPYLRSGDGTGLEGTWSRARKMWLDDGDGLTLVEDVTDTLDLMGDGTLEITVEGPKADQPDDLKIMLGSWVLVPNENYIENYGDYLVFNVETIDGEPQDPPMSWVDLMVIRHDMLLLSPKVRAF